MDCYPDPATQGRRPLMSLQEDSVAQGTGLWYSLQKGIIFPYLQMSGSMRSYGGPENI